MPIPTVSGTEVVRAPYAGAGLNAAALMGPGHGMQAIAQGLGDVSEVSKQFADRKQAAINAATSASAEMQMKKAANDYQIEMTHSVDSPDGANAEESWVPGWQKKSDALKNQLLSDPHVSQQVKDHLGVSLGNMAAEHGQIVATQANTRTIQRQKAKLSNVADFMFENGDKEKGEIAIDAMTEHGLIFPEEAYGLKERGRKMADLQAVNRGINQDPFSTLDQLNDKTKSGEWTEFTDLDENQREALKVEASRQIATIRHETVNDLVDRSNQGEILGKDELQGLVDQKKIKATEMRWLLQQQGRGGHDPAQTAKFAETLRAVAAYDPLADTTKEKFANLFGQIAQFPPQWRDEMKSELQKRLHPTKLTTTDHATADVRKYIGELVNAGTFGDVSMVDGKAKNLNQLQQAHGTELELRQQLNAFVRDNPKADIVQQRDFVNTKIRTYKTLRASTPVLNAISGRTGAAAPASQSLPTVTTQAQRDALAPGASYIGADGKRYSRGK